MDLCYGLVKVLCDSGKAQQAINLLERLTRPGRGLAGEEFPTTIEAIVECPFSTVDRAYLILLYFYLVETDGSYPQRSFLGHPFDMVRRLDFYFLVPWSSPNETFLNILEETLLGLLREHDKPVSPPVAEWLFVNYLRLAEWHSKFQIKPELLQDIGSHPNLSLHLIDPRSASPDSLTHSMDLFTILQGTTLGVLRLALASAENPTLVNDILRSFWSDYFAEIMDDASLVASIASHLGCSELFPMALTVMRARRNLKSDVFFWLLAILSLVRLSTLMRTDIVGQLLEMGIAQIGEASPCILLLALLARLGEAADGRSGLLVGTTIRSRFTSVANSDRHRPKSQVEGIWASYAWQKHVAPPQDEFIELNIPSVRRGLALMSSLIHPYMVVD